MSPLCLRPGGPARCVQGPLQGWSLGSWLTGQAMLSPESGLMAAHAHASHPTHPSALPPPAPQATTARVRVINCVTGADETSQASGGVLPPTTDPDNAPYLVRGSSINRWDATLRVAGNNAPTAANPIPRPGCWRLQIALVSGDGLRQMIMVMVSVVSVQPSTERDGCAPARCCSPCSPQPVDACS